MKLDQSFYYQFYLFSVFIEKRKKKDTESSGGLYIIEIRWS